MSDCEEISIRCKFKLTDPMVINAPIDIDKKKLREQLYDLDDSVKMVNWGMGWVELEITNPILIEELLDREGWW